MGEDLISGLLAATAARRPANVAIEHEGVVVSYAAAAVAAARVADSLRELGAAPGHAVAWIGENTPACWLAYFGAAAAGVVLVPLHLRLLDTDLRRVLDHAGVRWILSEAGSLERARGLDRPVVELSAASFATRAPAAGADAPSAARAGVVAATDPAHVYYTSGSTGVPKGVILTHENVVSHARLAAAALGLSSDDVWLHAAPMFHLADAWATFAITAVGGVHRFVPRFEPTAVLDAFASGTTVTNLVPTMWSSLVRDPSATGRRYPSLRLLLSGGAAVSPDLVRRIRRTFPAEYAQTYGLTETSPYLTISRLDPEERGLPEDEACRRLARAGRPMPGVDVRVVDADGRDVPHDDASVGEVVARGPTVTPGYLRDPVATRAAIRDGWFRTGDLARVATDGRIDLVDRTGDVVSTGGEKVFSTDVERALADLVGVKEVAVVGTPDPHWGQAVTAVVVPEGDGVTWDALRAHARARLAAFKVPRRLVLVDALPRTPSGKVSKREVRALAVAARRGETAAEA